MAYQVMSDMNLCSQINVDTSNFTNQCNKRKNTQISVNNVNKKIKIDEQNEISELSAEECKTSEIEVLNSNDNISPVLVDNSNVNVCTTKTKNTCKTTTTINVKLKSETVLQSKQSPTFHQCKSCPRSFRSSHTLSVHYDFQHACKVTETSTNDTPNDSSINSQLNDMNMKCDVNNDDKTMSINTENQLLPNSVDNAVNGSSFEYNSNVIQCNSQHVKSIGEQKVKKICKNVPNISPSKVAKNKIGKAMRRKFINKKDLSVSSKKMQKIPFSKLGVQIGNSLESSLIVKEFSLCVQLKYQCSICKLVYSNEQDSKEHVINNHIEKNTSTAVVNTMSQAFKCKCCKKLLTTLKQCLEHKHLHCKKSMNNSYKSVKIVQRFYCSICNLNFSNQHFCSRHIRQVHPNVKNQKSCSTCKSTTMYKCFSCLSLFQSTSKLNSHVTSCKHAKTKSRNQIKRKIESFKTSNTLITRKNTQQKQEDKNGIKNQTTQRMENSSSHQLQEIQFVSCQKIPECITIDDSSQYPVRSQYSGSNTIDSTTNIQATQSISNYSKFIPTTSSLQSEALNFHMLPQSSSHQAAFNMQEQAVLLQPQSFHQQQNSVNLVEHCQNLGKTFQNTDHSLVQISNTEVLPANQISNDNIQFSNTISENARNVISTNVDIKFTNIDTSLLSKNPDLAGFDIIKVFDYLCPVCKTAHINVLETREHVCLMHPEVFKPTMNITGIEMIMMKCKSCKAERYSVEECIEHQKECSSTQPNSIIVNEVQLERFHCNKCPLHFSMRHHCSRHLKATHGIKVGLGKSLQTKLTIMYECENCLKYFQSMIVLQNHACRNISNKNDATYSRTTAAHYFCPLCDQHFPGLPSCRRHLSLTHSHQMSNAEELYKDIKYKKCYLWVCHICSSLRMKYFDTKVAIADHMEIHGISVPLTENDYTENTLLNDNSKTSNIVNTTKPQDKIPTPKHKTKKYKKKKIIQIHKIQQMPGNGQHIEFNTQNVNQSTHIPKTTSKLPKNSTDSSSSHEVMRDYVSNIQSIYTCPICKSEYTTEANVLQHIQIDHPMVNPTSVQILPKNQYVFKCKFCNVSIINSLEECKVHNLTCRLNVNKHKNECEVKIERMHCPSCNQHFAMRHHCIRHMCKAHGNADLIDYMTLKLTSMFKCYKCSKLYHSMESLDGHISRCTITYRKSEARQYSKVHDELYFCPECDQNFTSLYLCKRHINLGHDNPETLHRKVVSKTCSVWICHLCSSLRKKYFDKKSSLVEHMSKHKIELNELDEEEEEEEEEEEFDDKVEDMASISDDENTSHSLSETRTPQYNLYNESQDTTQIIMQEQWQSEKYEPPVYINTAIDNDSMYQNTVERLQMSQSQYIDNVSTDFYAADIIPGNMYCQNAYLGNPLNGHQIPLKQDKIPMKNEVTTESLSFGFQILNSISTTTENESHFEKYGTSNNVHLMQNMNVELNESISQALSSSYNYITPSNTQNSTFSNVILPPPTSYPLTNTYASNSNIQPYPSLSYNVGTDTNLIPPYNIKTELPAAYSSWSQMLPSNENNFSYQINDTITPSFEDGTNYADSTLSVDTYKPQLTTPSEQRNNVELNYNSGSSSNIECDSAVQVSRIHCPRCQLHFSNHHDCVAHVKNVHTCNLEVHEQIISKETTMYKCQNCDKLCVTARSLISHSSKCKICKNGATYSKINEQRYFCPYCQLHFRNIFLCERHMNLIHKNEQILNPTIIKKYCDLWICLICSTLRTKYFDTESQLADHMLKHELVWENDKKYLEDTNNVSTLEDVSNFSNTEDGMESIEEKSIQQLQKTNNYTNFEEVNMTTYSEKSSETQQWQDNTVQFPQQNQAIGFEVYKEQILLPQFQNTAEQAINFPVENQIPNSQNFMFQQANHETLVYQNVEKDPLAGTDFTQSTSMSINYTSPEPTSSGFEFSNTDTNLQQNTATICIDTPQQNLSIESTSNEMNCTSIDSKSYTGDLNEKTADKHTVVEAPRTHCSLCGQHFASIHNCLSHIKTFHKLNVNMDSVETKLTTMYKCNNCDKMCVSIAALTNHFYTCKNLKNWKGNEYSQVHVNRHMCPECPQSFSTVAMCKRHVNINHKDVENCCKKIVRKMCYMWVCHACSHLRTRYFRTKLLLADHMTKHKITVDMTEQEETLSEDANMEDNLHNVSEDSSKEMQNLNYDENLQAATDSNEVKEWQPPVEETEDTPIEIKTEVHQQQTQFQNVNYQTENCMNNLPTLYNQQPQSDASIQENIKEESICIQSEVDQNNITNYNSQLQPENNLDNSPEYTASSQVENGTTNNQIKNDFTSIIETLYSCVFCSKMFESEVSTLEHIKSTHGNEYAINTSIVKEPHKIYECKSCKVKVNTMKDCIQHKLECKNNTGKPYEVRIMRYYCPICFAHTAHKHHCVRHLINIHGESDMEVKNISYLETAMYKCEKCSKLFHCFVTLERHALSCQRSENKAQYSKVKRTRYFCKGCDQHFTCVRHCKSHITIHHPDNSEYLTENITNRIGYLWECHKCSSLRTKLFNSKSLLVEHMKNVHRITVKDSILDAQSEGDEYNDDNVESHNMSDMENSVDSSQLPSEHAVSKNEQVSDEYWQNAMSKATHQDSRFESPAISSQSNWEERSNVLLQKTNQITTSGQDKNDEEQKDDNFINQSDASNLYVSTVAKNVSNLEELPRITKNLSAIQPSQVTNLKLSKQDVNLIHNTENQSETTAVSQNSDVGSRATRQKTRNESLQRRTTRSSAVKISEIKN